MAGLDSILNRRPPSLWHRFSASPSLFIARSIYSVPQVSQSTLVGAERVQVVCISDTHNTHLSQPPLPDGDILIHAGDLTLSGTALELDDVLGWMNSQRHLHKIFIAGNHDSCLTSLETRHHVASTYPGLVYLENSSVKLSVRKRTLRVYGSPYTPKHGSGAFHYLRVCPYWYSSGQPSATEYPSTTTWSSIPSLTDILVTHGPPLAHLDLDWIGCYTLLAALWRVRPRLHVFGHIHAARGIKHVRWDNSQRAYEDVVAGRMKWRGLIRLLWWTTVEGVISLMRVITRELDEGTTFVNAAAIGGMRDQLKQGAIVVEI